MLKGMFRQGKIIRVLVFCVLIPGFCGIFFYGFSQLSPGKRFAKSPVRTFNATDPLFAPEKILDRVEAGTISVGVYNYGVRCACGFVLWRDDGGTLQYHSLQDPLSDDPDKYFGKRPPHLGYPARPDWIAPDAKVIVIYKGNTDTILYMADGANSAVADPMYPLLSEGEEKRLEILRKIRAQFEHDPSELPIHYKTIIQEALN